jgi:hypothetical protein
MRRRRSLFYLVAIVVSVQFFTGGCSSKPPVSGTGTPESRAQVATFSRDRELELTSLRAEMAATRIAGAKKEAELLELRDLVQQLRLEIAESRQALFDLRERAEQRQMEQTKERNEQERAAQSQTTQHLMVLEDTVVTLVQEVDQLRQEVTKSVEKESAKPSMPTSEKSIAPVPQGLRSDQPKRLPSTLKTPQPKPTVVPTILMMQEGGDATKASSITVQPGDTLSSLAKQHRTSVSLLQALNQLKGEVLLVGQVLILPSPTQR